MTDSAVEKILGRNRYFLGPNVPELYLWALSKVRPAAITVGEADGNLIPDPYELLISAPYAELVALKGNGGEAKPQAGAAASPATPPATAAQIPPD